MADLHIYLPNLTAQQLLKMLATAIETPPARSRKGTAHASALLATCRVAVHEESHDLYLQGLGGGPLTQEFEQFHQRLVALVPVPGAVQTVSNIPGAGLPVEQAVCILLRFCRGAEKPDPGRQLLVGKNLDEAAAGRVHNLLQATATEVRVATRQAAPGSTAADTYTLFDVRRDPARYAASILPLLDTVCPECTWLPSFSQRHQRIFLSLPAIEEAGGTTEAHGLDEDALLNFVRLVRASPQSFGIADATGENLLALLPRSDGGVTLLPLAGIAFRFLVRTLSPAEATAEVVELVADDAAMQRLEQALAHTDPPTGYRLALRPIRRRGPKDAQQVIKIRAQIERLSQDLAYHWNMGFVRPRLWRFAQSQLPALVDALCGFPRQDLKSGRILYGYAATRRHAGGQARQGYATTPDMAEGVHYLYISPDAFTTNGNLLPYWEHNLAQVTPTIRYWLDPFWARVYHPANQALVFVPEGTVLSPPIHRMEIEEMDQYLRKVLPRWFPDAFTGDQVPARRPIYLFDGYTSGDLPIAVTVLDLADFRPLAADIGWLNDNLLLMEIIDQRELIMTMADDKERQRLAATVRRQAETAVTALYKAGDQLAEQLATKSAEVTRVLTEELQAMLAATDKTIGDIQALDSALDRYRALHAQIHGLHAEADRLLANLLAAEDKLAAQIKDLEHNVQKQLGEAEATRQQAERQVAREVRNLEDTYQELTTRINSLR